ncbi:hypothetical protein CVS40_4838 [Lucilia cuprina]|nr:hypothetical protein CVS40_4838 [Lucilia cuprina]
MKNIFLMWLHKFECYSTPSHRSTYIREDIKLATFLRFLTTGSYQQTASVCRIITECLTFFENNVCGEWIKMVRPDDEYKIKEAFFESE